MGSYWSYLVVRAFTGVPTKGLFMLAFMYSVEFTGPDYKTYLGILIQVRSLMAALLKTAVPVLFPLRDGFVNVVRGVRLHGMSGP